jgi:HPt (histidine-containing phosphotransfer) domain-containing protein
MTKPIDIVKLEEVLRNYIPHDKIEVLSQQLDIEQGISNCNSQEAFQTIFHAFQDEIPDRASAIKEAYEKQDWERYSIEVHAIKSSARIIGANELSDLALQLEKAADDQDVALIQAEHDRLIRLYESYLSLDLSAENSDNDQIDKPPMPPEMWIDACKALREYAQALDMDNSLLIMKAIDAYQLPKEAASKKAEIKTLISQLKWDQLIKVLDEIVA